MRSEPKQPRLARPAVLALGLTLVFAAALGRGTHARVADLCPPAAIVLGAPEMASVVATILRRHGVGVPGGACSGQVIRASFARDGDPPRYALQIEDGFGRTSKRTVNNPDLAASLIEGWALGEDADVLSAKAVPDPDPPPAVAVAVAAPAVVVVPPAAAPAAELRPPPKLRLMAAFEAATPFGGTRSYGGALSGCAKLGPLCLGARARFARSEESAQLQLFVGPRGTVGSNLTRTGGDAVLIAALPIDGKHFLVAPRVGAGLGWLRSRRSLGELAPFPGANSDSHDDVALRAEAAVGGGLAVSMHWAIWAELGLGYDHRVSAAPDNVTAFLVPAPPRVTLQTALGFQYAR